MNVLGHDNYGMKVKSVAIASKAAMQNFVESGRWKWVAAVAFTKCDEYGSACLEVVRQHASVLVHSVERNALGKEMLHGQLVCLLSS